MMFFLSMKNVATILTEVTPGVSEIGEYEESGLKTKSLTQLNKKNCLYTNHVLNGLTYNFYDYYYCACKIYKKNLKCFEKEVLCLGR